MSFFPRDGKRLVKNFFQKRKKRSVSDRPRKRADCESFNNVFFPREEKDLLKIQEPSSRQCLSQEREKTCYLRWLSEVDLRSVGIETVE